MRWLPLVAGLIWGTAFPAIEIGLRTFTPLDIAFWRGFIGALSLGGWLAAQGALSWRFPRTKWAWLFVPMGHRRRRPRSRPPAPSSGWG